VSDSTDVSVGGAGEPVPGGRAGVPGRSSAEIRRDIEAQREQLGHSVEALRGRVNELTDWRRQVREHRQELIVGAAIVGFAVGGLLALRRRR
jgi:50S ribosomal subunit-associated GTPase HflX